MKMLTMLAIVAIVAAVGMVGTVTATSFAPVAHADKGGVPSGNSLKNCGANLEHHQPSKCPPI